MHNRHAQQMSRDSATESAAASLALGVTVLLISVGAFLVSLVLANRFIRRLKRLRDQTLALADESLPGMLARLRAGEQVDPVAEAPRLDFGRDEVGAVATAFEHAHAAAVTAAVTEARTREVCARCSSISPTAARSSYTASWRSSTRPNSAKRIRPCWTPCSASTISPPANAATPRT